MKARMLVLLASGMFWTASSQDTTRHGWPVTPFFETHPITGTFAEYRNTSPSGHFHSGADVPKPDGSPVYPVYNGVVEAIGTVATSGSNAYVRVRYNVSGLFKSDAYVHIVPNPALIVGDSVRAYQTVLGNIYAGQGHVHFTNGGPSGSSLMNAIRPNGGFTPYIDNYPPQIRFVKFYLDNSNTEFPNNRVSGNVDIRVHVAETNAADPSGISSSTTNNGTYIVGYKILSADRSTEVYVPPSNGVRFRFDRAPQDAYVNNVFAPGSDLSTHIYTITNGTGASDVNLTRVVLNNAWNTSTLPVGDYTVMVFTEDTRGLTDTVYVPVQVNRQDLVPPDPPKLQSIINDSTGRFTLRWAQNPEADLMGYRLYFSVNGSLWTLKENESRLTRTETSITYNLSSSGAIYFRIAAIDSATPPNVSGWSDVYGVRLNSSQSKTLIVDGFDRTELSGSWREPAHPFVMTHGLSMPTDFSSCANEEVIAGNVNLSNFNTVVWVLGDESTADETFNTQEQELVKAYLRNGGKLFVSGSEVAWDLDRPSGPSQSDRDFMRDFLKARYAGDDANEYNVNGAVSTRFSDVSLRYGVMAEGSPYEEDYPDYITAEPGAAAILHYGVQGNPAYAGVAYKGLFSGGTTPGAVVYLGFPFETIHQKAHRDTLMRRVFQYVDILPTSIDELVAGIPERTELFQNYPNPFNPSTQIGFRLHQKALVSLKVFDILGREVATLINEHMEAGNYQTTFDGAGLSSGVYFYTLEAGGALYTKKMLLTK